MPQKKRKSAEEILGISAPPAGRKSAEEILGITATSPQGPGFGENVAIGAERGYYAGIEQPATSLMDAIGAATRGDFNPLIELGQGVARGAYNLTQRRPAPVAVNPQTGERAGSVSAGVQLQTEEAQAKRAATPRGQQLQARRRELDARAALDPSISGQVTRGVSQGVVQAAPSIAAGVASGGSVPAIAAMTALQSAAEPENLAANVGGVFAGEGAIRGIAPVVAPIIRRIRGGRNVAPTAVKEMVESAEIGALDDAAGQIRGAGSTAPMNAPRLSAEEILGIEESQLGKLAATGGKAKDVLGPKLEADLALETGTAVTAAERTPVLEVISAVRKAGLLTGINTHLRNVSGTGLYQISEEAARVPAAVADLAVSAITKRRTISGPSLTAMGRSAHEAATKGWREAKEIVRKGATAEDLARLQLGAEIKSGSKILDGYVNGVFRLLNAEDKIFRTYAMRRALEDRARSQVLTEIRQGAIPRGKYGQRLKEIIDDPSEEIMAGAISDAEIAVFTNDNLLSKGLGAFRKEMDKTRGGRWVNFAIDTVAPFTKTPTNIIARMLEYSPISPQLGVDTYRVARGIIKGAMTEAEQRAFAQTFGRAAIGSGVIALGWKLYDAGLATGIYEDQPSKTSRDIAAGRPPGAIKIGDTWYQVTGFAPLGNLIAIGASLAREYEQEKGGKVGAIVGKTIAEQPLLEGAANVVDVLTGEKSPEEEAGRLVGSFVPTIVSDVGELIDPKQRQAEGFTAQIEKRIPGVRQMLPEKTDALGRPAQDRMTQFIDPTLTTKADEAPILKELVRLDVGLSKLKKNPKDDDATHAERVRRFGSLYLEYGSQLLANQKYQMANNATQRAALESLSDRVRAQIAAERDRGRMAGNPRGRLNANVIISAALANAKRKK